MRVLALAFLWACESPTERTATLKAPLESGEHLYGELCASCHGERGEGTSGPALRNYSGDVTSLAGRIRGRMPLGNPSRCGGDCPDTVADYILRSLNSADECKTETPGPRRLRLLTRREYRNTVSDLLGAPAGQASCASQTFEFDPQGRSVGAVHVAGSFNGWAPSVAAGGLPMAYSAERRVWTAKVPLNAGIYVYKFVLDGREWVPDPSHGNRLADGRGGQNSVRRVDDCGTDTSLALPFDPVADFPPETRPEGFLFDNNASAQVVTSVLAEEHLRAAKRMAAHGLTQANRLLPCSLDGAKDQPCIDLFLDHFGRRVFRRPLKTAELARYRSLVLDAPSFREGVERALQAFLVSPHFLYRSELGEPQADGTFRLTSWELASALSYFLWGTMPDGLLFEAASKNELQDPRQLEAQARRLLLSPRARRALGAFASQWLGSESVLDAAKAPEFSPGFDGQVRSAMVEETRRFVTHVVFDGSHTSKELFTADYTFLNGPLATFYGASGVTGAEFQKVLLASLAGGAVASSARSGILGHGSILATTAHSDQSSPIRRGLFVRRSLLCQEIPPPPPNAGGVPKVDPSATTRERFRQHTDNAFCRGCHQYIDGVGFGFERFDAVGRYRDTESGKPIDSTGDMNDIEGLGKGTQLPFSNLRELGTALSESKAANACLVQQIARYARGDKETEAEACAVQKLVATFASPTADLRDLLATLLSSQNVAVRK